MYPIFIVNKLNLIIVIKKGRINYFRNDNSDKNDFRSNNVYNQ
jgi:hypothetical protein